MKSWISTVWRDDSPTPFRPAYKCTALAAALVLGWQDMAMAAGVAVMEQSVKELGQAFSGAATNTEDGSSIYFNPGAMAQVRGSLLSLAGYTVIPSAHFRDQGSRLDPALGGESLRGGNGGDAPVTTLLPNLYSLQEVTDRVVLGFGFNVPFGSHNAYEAGWKGRYQTQSSELLALNFSPAAAIRITDTLSIGAGLDIQYLRAKFTNAIDFGTVCVQALGPQPCGALGLSPQQADGRVAVEGDDIGVGYNLGIYYAPFPTTRVGVSYRSRIEHELQGTAHFDVPRTALPLTAGGRFTDTRAQTRAVLPDSISFGFSQQFASRWTISGNILWTQWSLDRELRTQFASGQPDAVQALDWRDSWRYALGVSFRPDSAWTFRTGLAYDQSPVTKAQRHPRIPDNDRIWLTAGVSYRFFENFTVHGAYAHLFMADASLDSVGTTGDQLIGIVEQQTDILGLQLDWRY